MHRILQTLVGGIGLLVVAACGGGGGGGSSSQSVLVTPVPVQANAYSCPAVTATSSGTGVAVSGAVTFDQVPITSTATVSPAVGGLNFVATTNAPAQSVTVQALNAAGTTVLASTVTNALGQYTLLVPASTNVIIRARAEMLRTGTPCWQVRVRDNTSSDGLYVLDSNLTNSGVAGVTVNLNAASGWTGAANATGSYTAARRAAPFAILDAVRRSMQTVLAVQPDAAFEPLDVYWSVNNTSTSGNLASGQIGGSFFTRSVFSSGAATNSIYLLGNAAADADEYDASVIAHEWGHFYEATFTRTDSVGGAHSNTSRNDMSLAWGEGWGNAFSGLALGRTFYADTFTSLASPGVSQRTFLIGLAAVDLAVSERGWFSTDSMEFVLHQLGTSAGFSSLHRTFVDSSYRNGAPLTSVFSFADRYRALNPGQAATLNGLLGSVAVATSSDGWASNESNPGPNQTVSNLPVYTLTSLGLALTVRPSTQNDQASSDRNKLGYFRYVRLNLPAPRAVQFTLSGASNTDPDFFLIRNGVRYWNGVTAVAGSETAFLNLPAGEYVLRITDFNKRNTSLSLVIN